MQRYWAYIDDQGVIRIKLHTTDRAIQNCEQMPFCRGIFEPFYAHDYADAKRKIVEYLNKQQYYEKKVRE